MARAPRMLISSSRQMPPIDAMRNARQFAPRVKQTLPRCMLTDFDAVPIIVEMNVDSYRRKATVEKARGVGVLRHARQSKLHPDDPPRQSFCSGDRFKAILIAAALPSRLTRYRLGFYALSPKSQSVPGRTLAVQNSWCAQNSIRPKTVGRTTIRMVAWRPIKDDNSPNRVSGCKLNHAPQSLDRTISTVRTFSLSISIEENFWSIKSLKNESALG